MKFVWLCLLILGFAFAPANLARAQQGKDDIFEKEFKQLLPRGAIAAIRQPVFVTAGEANIDGGSWVLGVVIDGQAKAYSLNLLNSHEIVNDHIGATKFAAVW